MQINFSSRFISALSALLPAGAIFGAVFGVLSIKSSEAMAAEYLTAAAGWYDAIDQESESGLVGVEYRFNPVEYGVRPMLGVFTSFEGATYAYGGLHWDIELIKEKIYLSPNFAVGAYGEGDGKDLGGALEFRSGLELAYQLPNRQRLGVALNHLSNASIYDKNPGLETVIVTYSFPIGK